MMDYDRLTRKVRVMIRGEEYSLLLTLGGLAELEDKMLKEHGGLIEFVQMKDGKMPPLSVLLAAFKIGLKCAKTKVADADLLAENFCAEYGLDGLIKLFFVMLASSQILGKEASKNMLEAFDMESKDKVEIKNGKGVKKAPK